MASVPADAPTEIPVDSDAYPPERVKRPGGSRRQEDGHETLPVTETRNGPTEDGLPTDGPGSRYSQLGRGQDTAR